SEPIRSAGTNGRSPPPAPAHSLLQSKRQRHLSVQPAALQPHPTAPAFLPALQPARPAECRTCTVA
ncbi:MAG TPA: hypothetical protein VNZ22_09350, partial [Bacillota bacterium]|nr:hypothetical protein [Bacillota bacterium]